MVELTIFFSENSVKITSLHDYHVLVSDFAPPKYYAFLRIFIEVIKRFYLN